MGNRIGLVVIAAGFSLTVSWHASGQPTSAFGGAARPVGPATASTTPNGPRVQVETPPAGALGTGGTATQAGATARFGPPPFSPQKLAFADVWDGASSRATVTFTANGSGKTSAALPNGAFRVGEMRVMQIGGATSTFSSLAKSVKTRQSSPPWEIVSAAGEEIQIDVVFEPKFDLFKMGAGPKNATLAVKGPGPQIPWQMNVPVSGVFNGKRLGVAFIANAGELPAVQGDGQIMIPLTLIGTGNATSGLIKAKSLPTGTAFPAKTVAVGANENQKIGAPLWVTAGVTFDGTPRQIELVYDYGTGSSTTTTTIVPIPASLTRQTGMRGDCGISKIHTLVSLTLTADRSEATGTVQLTAYNNDPLGPKHTWVELAANGQGIWAGHLTTERGNLTNPTQGYGRFMITRLQIPNFTDIVRDGLMVGCQSSDRAGMPTNPNVVWEKAR
jgi:hypothetical protein